jgi:hypothetical protein
VFLACPKCNSEDVEFHGGDERAECPDCHHVGRIDYDADCVGDPPEFVPCCTMLEEAE